MKHNMAQSYGFQKEAQQYYISKPEELCGFFGNMAIWYHATCTQLYTFHTYMSYRYTN